MSKLTLLVGILLSVMAGIASAAMTGSQDSATVPAKDAYGCVGEEGYSWCVKLQKCVRPSQVLIDNGLELTAENYHEYCQTNQAK